MIRVPVLLLLLTAVGAVDWPQWRGGPQRSGAVEAQVLAALARGQVLVEAWRSEPIPYGYGHQNGCVVGQGSPVVADGRVYVYINWPDPTSVPAGTVKLPSRVHDGVLCVHLATGATLWKTLMPGRSWRWGCSATLAVSGGKVVAMGSLGEGFCLDAATGQELWRWADPKKPRPDKESYADGISGYQASSLIIGDLAILNSGSGDVVCCDLANGAVRWRIEGRGQNSFSSPCAWPHDGGLTLLCLNGGLDPATGAPRWGGLAHGWGTPAVEKDRCAMMGGKGLVVSRLTASGPEPIAELELGNGGGNPAILDGRVYACGIRAVPPEAPGQAAKTVQAMVCVDATSGALLWETAGADLALGCGGQWSFTCVFVGSGVVAALNGGGLYLFDAADGKRLGPPRSVDNLKGGTTCAIAGDAIVTRGWKNLICYRAIAPDAVRKAEDPPVAALPAASVAPVRPAWATDFGTDPQGTWASFTLGAVQQRLRWCPPGTFAMGWPAGKYPRDLDEDLHAVTLTDGFWLGNTEVTQALYQEVTGSNPSRFTGDANRPVEQVSWQDCQKFLRQLGEKVPGLCPALPSEAQWEYACRAGTTTAQPGPLREQAWYNDTSGKEPHPVGSRPANPWGLFDMLGNVAEWCQDAFAEYPSAACVNPLVTTGVVRVHRGGSWNDFDWYCRAANRDWLAPDIGHATIGLRICTPAVTVGR